MATTTFSSHILLFLVLARLNCLASQIGLGSTLLASDDQTWISDNSTFALGFTSTDTSGQFQLAIWFAQIPGDRTVVWSANRNSPVTKDAILELDTTGNLVLTDGDSTTWRSNTSGAGIEFGVMSESGNFILYTATNHIAWQSFEHPSDTILPNQPLTVSLELTSSNLPSHGGYYTLNWLQDQPTSLSLALTFNLPNSSNASPEFYTNYSYWNGPDVSNVTGDVVAVLDEAGSFGIVYGESSDGAVYVYKNENDNDGLPPATNKSTRLSVLRRLILETNGNIRLYRWDNDVNGSRQWVPEWAAVSNPCDIAGVCGNGICNLDRSNTNASCTCLPGNSMEGSDRKCSANSSLIGKCNSPNENQTSELRIATVQQTNYYFSEFSVIANYSDIATVSKCGDACLSDCDCIASVYGLNEEETPYCWVLRSLDFGGFQDPGSTLFVKVRANDSMAPEGGAKGTSNNVRDKVLVIPIVVSMTVLLGLLFLLLYYYVQRRNLKKALENSLIVLGAPLNFGYRDLQMCTSNFSQLLGTGGFGSVFKGRLGDGTLVAVKKLDRVLPHGEKEFITEVNTIGSMHHMNLVRLCGYCSEGSHRLLVYEFMKNGSLDKWIFPSCKSQDRLLDWPTRFNIAIATAQGIAYFHEQCRNRIIHCDIKPENILLDENFCPKVSDFGLAKLMGRELSQVVTMVRGTRGYLAPEWVSNRPITVKADVYSYGMLLLEIVGGRRNLDMSFDAKDFFYPGWAYKGMTNGTPLKVADRRLGGAVEEEELSRALKVGFWCIQDEVFMRPSMGEVVKMLEGSMNINGPPMPQTVLELVEEGLDQVYRAMKREFNPSYSFSNASHPSSHATCSYSTMSPR
ncbi:Pkinase domain-containing protein/S_locus_glycop domain-containing protein/B_lectin domain-containing protein [Cephalotus follicularis]|uniref:Receptor-like serine/threonine-protein kinase n=1 Tax=Cephalotus follicularis TaxID=3775 RepID=A0A1Q3CXN3_CEPFO|nr:Pkinase domain-containing protein/S_locus_glycop domain-containing protein/B_lectin domain-containing protein [Cephalotus follicularis]